MFVRGLNNRESPLEEQIWAILQNILRSERCRALAHCLPLLIYTQSIKFRAKRLETAKFEEENQQKRRVLTGDLGV